MPDVQQPDREGVVAFSNTADTDCANVVGSFRRSQSTIVVSISAAYCTRRSKDLFGQDLLNI